MKIKTNKYNRCSTGKALINEEITDNIAAHIVDYHYSEQDPFYWYEIYSNGKVRQGGISPVIPGAGAATVYFPLEMKDQNYLVYGGIAAESSLSGNRQTAGVMVNKTATHMSIDFCSSSITGRTWWLVEGFMKGA